MRFKGEFIVPEGISKEGNPTYIETRKERAETGIGYLLSKSFGWQSPVNGDKSHHRLEIEAFPMDKWVEFKQKMMNLFKNNDFASNGFDELNKITEELESFGKPSGDAITNVADQMEYRGPSSYCKACEDEKNGVKHIMAQKHTCRK